MTMDQKADWFADEAVKGRNRAAARARNSPPQDRSPTSESEEIKNRANREFAGRMANRTVEGLRNLAKQKFVPKAPIQEAKVSADAVPPAD